MRAQRTADQLHELVTLYQDGALRIHIRARFPLEQIAQAHREVEGGHGKGEVIVTISE